MLRGVYEERPAVMLSGRSSAVTAQRLLRESYYSTVKPCSVPYLMDASCQVFRASGSLVPET